ncbi:MAG: PAS domain S-box protein, partial [Deltaproteobacteria bacterium]|nr:PAS domain S-box protein [Deltaproteobacteria bacterium]
MWHEEDRCFREIINTMNDGVVLVSPDGRIMMVNRAMEEITGYSREELLGASCAVFHCDTCLTARAEGKGHWCEIFDVGRTHRRSCFLMR